MMSSQLYNGNGKRRSSPERLTGAVGVGGHYVGVPAIPHRI